MFQDSCTPHTSSNDSRSRRRGVSWQRLNNRVIHTTARHRQWRDIVMQGPDEGGPDPGCSALPSTSQTGPSQDRADPAQAHTRAHKRAFPEWTHQRNRTERASSRPIPHSILCSSPYIWLVCCIPSRLQTFHLACTSSILVSVSRLLNSFGSCLGRSFELDPTPLIVTAPLTAQLDKKLAHLEWRANPRATVRWSRSLSVLLYVSEPSSIRTLRATLSLSLSPSACGKRGITNSRAERG